MIAQNSEVYNPSTYLFSLYTYMEKDLCRGVVYFTVLCDHPYLVSLLFAVLVSLHPVTFSNVFYIYRKKIHSKLVYVGLAQARPNYSSVVESRHQLQVIRRVIRRVTSGILFRGRRLETLLEPPHEVLLLEYMQEEHGE